MLIFTAIGEWMQQKLLSIAGNREWLHEQEGLHRIKGADELAQLFAEEFTIDNTRTGAVGVATGVGAGAGAAAAGDDTAMIFCSSVCCYDF